MLRSARDIIGWSAIAHGGAVGVIRDLLVDDRQWNVRHLTVETSNLAHRRHVLISPRAVRRVNGERKRFELSLDQWQVAAAPDIEYDPPVAVQQEQKYYDAFGWRYYWQRPAGSMEGRPTPAASRPVAALAPRTRAPQEADPHLRSVVVMTGYRVKGLDEKIGVVEDFLVDDQSWQIGCLITRNPAAGIAVPVKLITTIDWATDEIHVNLTKTQAAVADRYAADNPSCGRLAA